jgi:uncharacterized protein (TIGR03437 family)
LGLDQLNLPLPAGLAGQGMVDVLVEVDGKPANVVKVNFK